MNMEILEQLEQRYKIIKWTLSDFLNVLEEKYIGHLKKETSLLSDNVITPDKNYVQSLISCLSELQVDGLERELKHLKTELEKIAESGDFDDADEIMEDVHGIIEKYIYESDTKVSSEDWKKLETYLKKAGYCVVPVNPGDDITPYKTYFKRPIGADGGKKNTIKQIQLKPYILKFYDGEEVREDLKLCGKCTYYK